MKKCIFAMSIAHPPMIVHNRILPPPRFLAINLFGVIFVRHGRNLSDVDLNHERIHTAQMVELLFVGFYLWYMVEWLVLLGRYRNAFRAYRHIRFEREAYKHQHDFSYLRHRRLWAFLRTDTDLHSPRNHSRNTTKPYHKHSSSEPQT